MPVLFLVDVSLSMLRNVDERAEISRKKLAVESLTYLIEKLAALKLEFVSLLYFAEETEIVADFTKDYASLIELLKNRCDLRTKTDYFKAFQQILALSSTIWGGQKCHCVVVTDCVGFDEFFKYKLTEMDENFTYLLKYSRVNFQICCLNERPSVSGLNNELFWEFITKNAAGGDIFYLGEAKTKKDELKSIFDKIYETNFAPMKIQLKCGSLGSQVLLYPKIDVYRSSRDFELIERRISNESINVCGFLKPADLGNPPIISKHIILAAPNQNINRENVEAVRPLKCHVDEEKQPNFCVLLHGAMKIEDTVALCNLGADWYGFIYCCSDSKRSNLVLHLFKPGYDSIPWLGNLNQFVFRATSVSQQTPTKSASSSKKPSYATTNPCWVQNYGFQSDLQKIVRYAKKLPDKETNFYQELNRIINHALSLGCVDLVLSFLEKEKALCPSDSPQMKHLNYITKLIGSKSLKYGEPILPLYTK